MWQDALLGWKWHHILLPWKFLQMPKKVKWDDGWRFEFSLFLNRGNWFLFEYWERYLFSAQGWRCKEVVLVGQQCNLSLKNMGIHQNPEYSYFSISWLDYFTIKIIGICWIAIKIFKKVSKRIYNILWIWELIILYRHIGKAADFIWDQTFLGSVETKFFTLVM